MWARFEWVWAWILSAFCLFSTMVQADTITIAIQPFMPLSQSTQAALTQQITQVFPQIRPQHIIFLANKTLPNNTKIPPRQRYSTLKLLDFLEKNHQNYTRIVGITDADITLPKNNIADWGVFGAARFHQPAAMISTHRLRKYLQSPHQLNQRLARVVTHELGHTFGLPHCATPRCLMHDAEGKVATIDEYSGHFCEKCREKLASSLPQ